jgi:uncharacterized protein YbjT (DUF2867 family)
MLERSTLGVRMAKPTILVTGATGKQGGSVIRALDEQAFQLRAMTRKPQSDAAKALGAHGVEIVHGDLDDEASLAGALRGVWGVFAVQNTWEAGVEREEAQGKRLARAARAHGVEHYVYSSVGSADRQTGIPHFDNKWRIEETVRSLAFPSHVILRPVFFMENLVSPSFLNGDTIYTALEPSTVLQMIAVHDIGRFAARVFVDRERFAGRAIDLAGDARTMPDAAAVLTRAFERAIGFVRIPIDDVRKHSEDVALMLEWFDRVGYDADIPALVEEFGFTPLRLEQWAAAEA